VFFLNLKGLIQIELTLFFHLLICIQLNPYFVLMTQRFFLLFIFCFSVFFSYSQEYFFRNYNVKDGLLNNQLHDLIQAKDNTLWFTSFYGLCQFDGTKFTTFTEDDGLCSNQVRNVFEDSKGRIWVSSWRDKGISIIENGNVWTPKDTILMISGAMNTAYENEKGVIWLFGTHNVIKYENNKFEMVFSTEDEKEYNVPNDIAVINENELYVTQLGNGVLKITLEPFSIEHINNESHGINNICYSAYKDKKGTYWFGCYGSIYSFENNVMTNHKIPMEFDKCRVWSIAEDQDGYFWLATYGGGVIRWDKKEEFITIDSKGGLSDDYCYTVIVDRENNKWFATDLGGLDKLTDFSFQYFTKNTGLKNNHVYGIGQQKNGNIVIGTESGFSIVKENKIDTTIYEDLSVHSISSGDELWYTSNAGYGVLKEDYQITNINHDNSFNFIDSKEMIVAGLSRVIQNHEEVYYREHQILQSAFYFDNLLYISTNYGLLYVKNGKTYQIKDLMSMTFSEVYTSVKISKNEVLVSNPNELVYLKNNNGSLIIKRFSRKKLGGVTGIYALLLDGNDLWIGAQNSLAKIDFDELLNHDILIMENYDITHGFIKGITVPGAIFKDKDGAIWVGTSAGALKFSPDLTRKNLLPPILNFKKIKLFSREFNPELYTIDQKIVFPHDKNHLTFSFQAVSLTNPDKIQCKYRLLGLSNQWSEAVSIQPITYPFLNPGEYTFEFIANNGDGVWSKDALRYSFTILPPFWRTWWFYTFVGIGLFITIISIFYRQKTKAENTQKVQEKFTRDIIEAQEEERKRISKGLHDGIGQNLLLIKNALQSEKIDGAKTMVTTTIEEVRSISRNLHPFQLEKFGLTKSLESMIEELDQSFKEIIFTEEIDAINDLFSKEQEINIYRIIQECSNNIIKHANASAARIVVQKQNHNIEIIVYDNGKGFDLEKNKDIINSLGLKSIRERVKYLNGTVLFDSKINKGTKITLLIPFEK